MGKFVFHVASAMFLLVVFLEYSLMAVTGEGVFSQREFLPPEVLNKLGKS